MSATTTAKTKRKKVLSPIEKLKKRISKEFPKKKYIGDINVNDKEYDTISIAKMF